MKDVVLNVEKLRFLGKGTYSDVFLIKQQNEFFVYKENQRKNPNWFMHEMMAKIIRRRISAFQGNLFVPKCIELTENYEIEEFFDGLPFSAEVFNNLPRNQQLRLSKDFAEFLSFMHEQEINEENYSELCFNQWPSEKRVKTFLSKYIPTKEIDEYLNLENWYKNINHTDEKTVLCHMDLKPSNVLFNVKNKQLAVLDFGTARNENIYYDFFPTNTLRFGFSYLFLKMYIQEYNKISKQQIDIEKVKNLHLLGCYRHAVRLCINNEQTPEQTRKTIELLCIKQQLIHAILKS